MRVALICTVRLENQYLREFVEWYKRLNFDSIILLDNNWKEGDDNIYDVIDEEDLKSGKVIVEDIKDQPQFSQTVVYERYYQKWHDKYDWIAVIDADEFLDLNLKYNNDVKQWLSQPKFQDKDSIIINWEIYDDNGLIYYEDKPVVERFTKSINSGGWHVKTILNCHKVGNPIFIDPHHIETDNACDANGNKVKSDWCNWNIDYSEARLRHYMYKTIEETIKNKFRKHKDHVRMDNHDDFNLEGFFEVNKKTPEKIEFAKKLLKELYDYDLNI